jgi:hypothetical protein
LVNSTQKHPVRERSSYADALSVAHMFAARFDVARSRDKGVAEAGTDKAKGDTRAAKWSAGRRKKPEPQS